MSPASLSMTSSAASSPTALARHERNPLQNRTIVLKSCYGKTGHKLRLEPCRDGRTGRFLGVDNLSEEEKRRTDYVVQPGVTYLDITDGHTFDLTDARQAKDWQWVKHCPQIVGARDETNFHLDAEESRAFEGADNEFYVFDEANETATQERRFDKQFEALTYIHNQKGASALYQVARLLGSNMESSSVSAVRTFLLGKAQKHPEQVLAIEKDADSATKLFLFAALDKEIIRRRAGVYYYNEMALGTTEAQAILWLQEDRNYSFVRAIQVELYPTRQPKVISSQANQELFARTFTPAADAEAEEQVPQVPRAADTLEIEGEDEDLDANDPTRPAPLTRAATLAKARAAAQAKRQENS